MYTNQIRLKTQGQILTALISAALLVGVILALSMTKYYPNQDGNAKPGLDIGKFVLSFEPDDGQTSAPARFTARAPGSTIYFSPSDVAIEVESVADDRGAGTSLTASAAGDKDAVTASLIPMSKVKPIESAMVGTRPPMIGGQRSSTTVRMRFIGADSAPEMVAGELLPGKVNYLIGNDPKQWRSNLPTYAGVVYHDLYPGIDLKYEGTASNLKGTYTLAPGADPTQIRWSYDGPASA